MAIFTLPNRAMETTTSTGTGTINLGGAVGSHHTLVAGAGSGHRLDYCIAEQAGPNFEIGWGVATAGSPDTLSRLGVYESTNGNALVNFPAGTKDVFGTIHARALPFIGTKLNDESRLSNTTLTVDSDLQCDLDANQIYMFSFLVLFGTPTTGGFKYDLNYSGTSGGKEILHEFLPPGASAWTILVDAAFNVGRNTVASGTAGMVRMTGKISTTTAGTLALRWAQQASQASNTSVWQGSSYTLKLVA